MLNILLTSVGRRTYLVDYIKEALGKDGDIFVANNTPETPVFQLTDKKVITPLIYDKSYIPFLMDYCKQNSITVIIPLFDIDLPVLSKNKKLFEDIGVRVIVSDSTVTRICNDKWETSPFLYNGSGYQRHTCRLQMQKQRRQKDISFPLIVKPRWGMIDQCL